MSNLDLVHKIFGSAFRISRWYIPGHDGIDLPAKVGTPIRAVADGRVAYARDARIDPHAGANWAIGGGNVVNVDIGNSLTTQYAHLNDIYVKPGQYVKRGQIIGTVGSTGGTPNSPTANFGAAGAHLHFGLWDRKSNKMINPTRFLTAVAAGWTDTSFMANASKDDNAGVQLGGWGDHVKFPVGHRLTASDVDKIIDTLRANGFFAASDPVTGAIGESITRDILMRHVGEPWNKDLQIRLQGEFNNAAREAVSGTAAFRAVGDALGKLTDPANWVRILALGAGAIMVGIGGYGILRSTGADQRIRVA